METIRVGLISDTHGLLRPEAMHALQGVNRIIHAGDIGSPDILGRLREIAPVVAVRGNNDRAAWADAIPATEMIEIGGIPLYVLHDLNEMAIDPKAAGVQIVVSGHSHRPSVKTVNGVLFVNPGSAGPRRFKLPVSLALLDVTAGKPSAIVQILDL